MAYRGWAPYVSVAARRATAKKAMEKLQKKGQNIQPIVIEGKKISQSFWGQAWCNHLEKFSDYENRLPRGRTYVRNGSVCHLEVKKGLIEAKVSGSEIYQIKIEIKPLSPQKWSSIKAQCTGEIGSILELLQGKLSDSVMKTVTDQKMGLFPHPNEIKLRCDCPDWATMCKHVAAVLYGVGARLDQAPEMLFELRGVNHEELILTDISIPAQQSNKRRVEGPLADIFGIEIDDATPMPKIPARKMPDNNKISSKKSPSAKQKSKPSSLTTPKKITKTITKAITKKPKTSITTAAQVKRLQKKFTMNNTEFAKLIGVSTATLLQWEKQSGKLNIRTANQNRLDLLSTLDRDAAWQMLDEKLNH